MVLWAMQNSHGGEIFVPKIPSYRIMDVAKAIGPDCEHPIVGIRPGEKIHEEMITVSDSFNTVDLGHYFAILSSTARISKEDYCKLTNATPIAQGVAYSSDNNPVFLSVDELVNLIQDQLNVSL